MNFDIKNVKSWANRYDVKVGDEGYFADSIEDLKTEDNRTRMIAEILDDHAFCFRTPTNRYSFFLPLDAVKEDKSKEKKYRPFKSMIELTEIAEITNPNSYNVMGVDEVLFVKRKCNGHYEKVLITHLEYDKYHNLIAINNKNLKTWFENYELKNGFGKYVPFGVEVKDE